jgi:DNA-binding MarR family transcriptional regulator
MDTDPYVRLFDEVRLLDHRLVQVADALHGGGGVSTPGRVVLEYLDRHGPTAVPAIARARHVTRQHIQTIVDALAAKGLVEPAPNPAHRTSPLFGLTDSGRRTIRAMRERERAVMEERLGHLDPDDADRAAAVLAAVRAAVGGALDRAGGTAR